MPAIPIRRPREDAGAEDCQEEGEEEDDDDDTERQPGEDSPIILAALTLGLNHIRTRSAPSPSPLRFSSSVDTPSVIVDHVGNNDKEKAEVSIGVDTKPKWPIPSHHLANTDQGKSIPVLFRIVICLCFFPLSVWIAIDLITRIGINCDVLVNSWRMFHFHGDGE